MRLEQFAITGQRDIDKISAVVEVLESAGDVVLEVLPAKLKLIVHCDDKQVLLVSLLFYGWISKFIFLFFPRLNLKCICGKVMV